MVKWYPPDPNKEGAKNLKYTVIGNRVEIEPGPGWEPPKELKPGRPLSDEDKKKERPGAP